MEGNPSEKNERQIRLQARIQDFEMGVNFCDNVIEPSEKSEKSNIISIFEG